MSDALHSTLVDHIGVSARIDQPTHRLRWHKGVLQQYWVMETRKEGARIFLYEWRDVPTDDSDG